MTRLRYGICLIDTRVHLRENVSFTQVLGNGSATVHNRGSKKPNQALKTPGAYSDNPNNYFIPSFWFCRMIFELSSRMLSFKTQQAGRSETTQICG